MFFSYEVHLKMLTVQNILSNTSLESSMGVVAEHFHVTYQHQFQLLGDVCKPMFLLLRHAFVF